jgi:hypothetical protein
MKSLVKALLLAVFVAAPCLAQQSPSSVIGGHATVGTDGSQADGSVNLITRNAGPINFYTDNVKRGAIDSTGSFSWLTGIVLANETFLSARNAANTADVALIKLSSSDDTVINSSANDYLTLRLDDDANRLINFTAGSDTVLELKFGDQSTANQTFDISARTSDAADNGSVRISGGGAVDNIARGANLALYGNENSGAGWVILASGNASGADIRLDATDDLIFRFAANTTRALTFDSAGNDMLDMTWGDGGATATQGFAITASTSEGDDDSSIVISAGGGKYAATGIERGAYIQMFGQNVVGNNGGDVQIVASNDADSQIKLFMENPSSTVDISDVTTGTLWSFENDGDLISSNNAGDIGWSAVNAANQACNTTCTSGCVFGMNTGALGNFVGCADATADTCICAGAS